MTAVNALNIAALLALLPVTIAVYSGAQAPTGSRFWILMAVAVAGPVVWTVSAGSDTWRTDLAFALWVTVSASLCVFAASAVFAPRIARLAPLFLVLMTGLATLAGLSAFDTGGQDPTSVLHEIDTGRWVWVHIAVSVLTYALLSVAAVASLAALIQERALKRKTPLKRLSVLPSVVDCEGIVVQFLWLSAAVLSLGIATGTGTNLAQGNTAIELDHKTLFALAALVTIGGLLFAHLKTGARGRQVARLVMLAYLFVTLAYPGVKFVTGILMSG